MILITFFGAPPPYSVRALLLSFFENKKTKEQNPVWAMQLFKTQLCQVELESSSRKESWLSGAGMVGGRSEVSFV